jgi:hypothetical protein
MMIIMKTTDHNLALGWVEIRGMQHGRRILALIHVLQYKPFAEQFKENLQQRWKILQGK